jgi:ligand-binding sensor domain-containing protein
MRLILLLASIIWCFSTFSQRYFFKTYSTPDGLAQSQVASICQDSMGYLWIGTFGGISRYNGNNFTNFSTDDGLLNNRINVVQWINAQLFIGHQGGISIYKNNKISKFPLSPDNFNTNVTDIVQFNNKIMVSTNGDGLYVFENGKLQPIQLLSDEGNFIRDLLVWNDKLYIATRNGVVVTSNLNTVDTLISDGFSISSLTTNNNQLVVSTFYNGIQFYKNHQLVHSILENEELLINYIATDSKNNLWICSKNGLIKYTYKKTTFYTSAIGLPIDVISTIFEDSDQNIWIGTQGKGLVKAGVDAISYFDKSTGLPSDIVLCGVQNKKGDYFFGSIDNGILKTRDFKNYTVIPTTTSIWSAIADVDGKSWFGTKDGLYAIDDNNKVSIQHFNDEAPGYKITAFHKIDANRMYVGGSHGIALYQNGKFTPIGSNHQQIGTIRSITLRDQQLLVGTDIGLYFLDTQNKFQLIGNTNHATLSLVKTASNRIFFGSEDGLFELLKNNSIVRVRFSTDVASNYVNFLSSHAHNLIIGTNNGVYIIDTQNGSKFTQRIGASEGLLDPETNLNSSFIDKKNNLWFGTASALIKFDLNKFNLSVGKVKLVLTSILLDYKPFDYTQFGAKSMDEIPQNMTFSYQKNNLQFNLDAVALSDFDNLLFQFKVNGLNDAWMPASKTSHIILNELAPGEYELHARVMLENGKILDQLTIKFTIRQAFYKTWWFICVAVAFLTTIVFWWIKTKIKREQEKYRLEQAEMQSRLILLEQESLNASMNRHFIFNSLNSIQYFINISDKLSANKYLSNFAKLIRKNLDTSSEHSSMVGLNEEIERIRLYLSLEAMRFNEKFTYTISTNSVDLESTMIPAMMIQPFVENSIIHGILPQTERKGEISIDVDESNSLLTILIKDNGIGIEQSIHQKSNISGDHQSKGMEITTKRIKLMRQMLDKNMEIIGPRQTYDSNHQISGTEVIIKISTQ